MSQNAESAVIEISPEEKTLSIAKQNDHFRNTFDSSMGDVVVTHGVSLLLSKQVLELMNSVKSFDKFHPEDDPHGEHDFGAIELFEDKFFWKIDCYDKDTKFLSPDASDPSKTKRVLTVMKSNEY